jgi:tetratricopeptide (TPR) repeat protein
MIRASVFFTLSSIIFFSCNQPNQEQQKEPVLNNNSIIIKSDSTSKKDDCETMLQECEQYDKIFLNATNLDANVALKGVVAFNNYANLCHNDSLGAIYILKAGQICQVINDYDRAKTMFEKCINDFPKFNNRGAAMFLLAQLYDGNTPYKNENEAKIIYQKIIKEYPKSSFAEDAKSAIKYLGKSDEEMVKEFLNKNK